MAKPPYELAERRGQVQFGEGLTKFSGAIWEQSIEAQAENEIAEARGQLNTVIESFETFAASNPNASPEELQKEWGKISTKIKAIPGTLKTRIAKAEFGNFLAKNERVIQQRVQTSIEAIRFDQQLTKYKAVRGTLIAKGTTAARNELVKLNTEQIKAGLLNPEMTEIQQAADFAEMDRQSVFRSINQGRFAVAHTAVTQSEFLSEKEKTSLYTRVKQAQGAAGSEAKTVAQAFKEAEQLETIKALAEMPNNIAIINKLQNPENRDFFDGTLERRTAALTAGQDDPFIKSNAILRNGIATMIREDPGSIPQSEIVSYFSRGLSAADTLDFIELRNSRLRKDNPYSVPHIKRTHGLIDDMVKAGVTLDGLKPRKDMPAADVLKYYTTVNALHAAVDKHAEGNPTPTETEKFTTDLMKPYVESQVMKWWEKALFMVPAYGVARIIGARRELEEKRALSYPLRIETRELGEPQSAAEFENTIRRLYREGRGDMAKVYDARWRRKWE